MGRDLLATAERSMRSMSTKLAADRLTQRLTEAQILALYDWIWPQGALRPRRHWKRDLLDAWYRAGQGVPGYNPQLQQIRNGFGPEWLDMQTPQYNVLLALSARTRRQGQMILPRAR